MVDSINIILISFFSSLAVGGTVVIAQYYGQRNIKAMNNTSKQILYAGTLISLVITLLIWIFRYAIIHFLFGSAEITVINYFPVLFGNNANNLSLYSNRTYNKWFLKRNR